MLWFQKQFLLSLLIFHVVCYKQWATTRQRLPDKGRRFHRRCLAHEIFVKCRSCEKTCENLSPVCSKVCLPPGCQCKDSYVRYGKICIKPNRCPIDDDSSSDESSSNENITSAMSPQLEKLGNGKPKSSEGYKKFKYSTSGRSSNHQQSRQNIMFESSLDKKNEKFGDFGSFSNGRIPAERHTGMNNIFQEDFSKANSYNGPFVPFGGTPNSARYLNFQGNNDERNGKYGDSSPVTTIPSNQKSVGNFGIPGGYDTLYSSGFPPFSGLKNTPSSLGRSRDSIGNTERSKIKMFSLSGTNRREGMEPWNGVPSDRSVLSVLNGNRNSIMTSAVGNGRNDGWPLWDSSQIEKQSQWEVDSDANSVPTITSNVDASEGDSTGAFELTKNNGQSPPLSTNYQANEENLLDGMGSEGSDFDINPLYSEHEFENNLRSETAISPLVESIRKREWSW